MRSDAGYRYRDGDRGDAGAPNAGHVWATDISTRCTIFAEFNRRLAGLENMTVVEGDMYAPVEGLTFDRIVTHPPYIPAKQTELIFRDGGEDGEQIIRRAVEGLPRFLRPGGKFYALLMATDREGEDFQQRIRNGWGQSKVRSTSYWFPTGLHTPEELFAEKPQKASAIGPEEWRFRQAMWAATKTHHIFYGWIPDPAARGRPPAATGRAQAGRNFTGRAMEWLLEWESAVRGSGGLAMLLEDAARAFPILRTSHRSPGSRRAILQRRIQAGGGAAVRSPGQMPRMAGASRFPMRRRDDMAGALRGGAGGGNRRPWRNGGRLRASAAAFDVNWNSAECGLAISELMSIEWTCAHQMYIQYCPQNSCDKFECNRGYA
jgi:SAM-dependent methyltransferase